MRETFKKFNILLMPILLLCILALVLLLESAEVTYKVRSELLVDLPAGVRHEKKDIGRLEKTCLVLVDSTQEHYDIFSEHVISVMDSMRVSYDCVDVAVDEIPDFSAYKTAVIVFQDLDAIGERVINLTEWVESDGGRVMFFCTPNPTAVYRYLRTPLGVVEGGESFSEIRGVMINEGFMLGAKDFNYHWEDPMATAQNIRLAPATKVYATSDSNSRLPLIWSNEYGKGLLVMSNHGLAQKANKGLTAATYALLDDACIYPVINASTFFLDDFPSPVPLGNSSFIRKFYNRDISSFIANIWWPDVLQIVEDYGVKYTGVVIEDYNDKVVPPFSP